MPTPPINQNHVRQEMTGPVNFPEIQSAIAASEDRRVQRAQPRTPTSNMPYTNQTQIGTNTLSKCAVCCKVANFLCSGCQKVYYCTVQCQVSRGVADFCWSSFTILFSESSLVE